MPAIRSTKEFFEYDYYSALFPMDTCRFLITNGERKIQEHIKRCLSDKPKDSSFQFLAQTRVYASKPKNHLRRTVKLDPVSELFIYDVIYRNRSKFRRPFKDEKNTLVIVSKTALLFLRPHLTKASSKPNLHTKRSINIL